MYFMWFYCRKQLDAFFTKPTSPVNLAIIRIVLFGFLLTLGSLYSDAISISASSPSALVPPPGWNLLLEYLPVNERLTQLDVTIFLISCVFALLGLGTQYAIVIATVTGLFALGIPQFYGKIDHYHHLWLIMFILCFTRSGDALSFDAAIKSYRFPHIPPPQASRIYTYPIRVIWILLALTYFFPGFWKFTISGLEWALSDNLKYKMHTKWIESDGWTPLFRLDHYPLLYMSAALGTLVWELGFIFTIFFDRIRNIAAMIGIVFHTMTFLLMNIFFKTLMAMYVVFIDWDKWFKRIGGYLFQKPLIIHYDKKSSYSKATAHLIMSFDLFGKTSIIQQNSYSNSTPSKLFPATIQERPVGFLHIMLRVPFLLIVFPILFIGRLITPSKAMFKEVNVKPQKIAFAGSIVISFQLFAGFALIDSWPFAVYPTFATIEKSIAPTIKIEAYNADDNLISEVIPLTDERFRDYYGNTPRLRGFIREIQTSSSIDPEHFIHLVSIWQGDEDLEEINYYKFINIELNTDPDNNYQSYQSKEIRYLLEPSNL
ncbi:MAG: HTTM domain-containing protein [Balneolales bacterium]